MHPRVLFLILFILQALHQTSASDCHTYLIDTTPSSFTCSSSGSYTASTHLPRLIQKSSKELTIAISFKPNGYLCGLSSDFNFLTVSINTNSGLKKVMVATYLYATGKVSFKSEDSSATPKIALTQSVAFVNKQVNLFLSVNLASNTFAAGILAGNGNFEQTITTVSYGANWVFDSASLISVCSDSDGSTKIACTVNKLKVAYSFHSSSAVVNTANSVKLIGDYKLNDGAGSATAANSQTAAGSLGSATLSPSPVWTSDGTGLRFTSASQLVTIPGFVPSSVDPLIIASAGFTFYIKINSTPISDTPIFTYYSSNMGSNIYQLQITSAMKLKSRIIYGYGTNAVGTTVLKIGEWNQVYFSFILMSTPSSAALLQINGGSIDNFPFQTPAFTIAAFSASDIIKIGGGFIGQVRRFQVYSPASLAESSESCSPKTCALTLGFSYPQTCVRAICTQGYYSSFGSCENCLSAGCLSCDPTNCYECSMGYYLSAAACVKCPNHCTSCVDSQTCLSCDVGFGFYNNLCTICPSGTTLIEEQVCQKFPEALKDSLSVMQKLNAALIQVVNLISRGSSISLSASLAGKVFSQIKYFDLVFSQELQVALLTWKSIFVSLGLTPDLPDTIIEKFPSRYVPQVFEKYEVSSSFFVNLWQSLGVITFAVVSWIIFKGLELLFTSQKNQQYTLYTRNIRVMAQNFLIATLYGSYGDIVLFSLIEYRSLVFGWNLSLLSFTFSIILWVVMLISFWYQINLLLNYQRIKRKDPKDQLEKFTKENEGNQILFKEFKDDSLTLQLYLFILSGRDIIISLILATLFDHPIVQTIITLILSLLMIAYLFVKRPLESSFDMNQILFFEAIGLAVGICVLINAILRQDKTTAANSRISIGKTVILFNMIWNITTAVFMLIAIFFSLREAYNDFKAKKPKNLTANDQFQNSSSSSFNDSGLSPLKPTQNQFYLNQNPSNQRFIINLDSEGESLQQSSLDLDMTPPLRFRPSQHRLRINSNLSRIAQFNQPSHQQISRTPEQAERFAYRKRPLRQNNSSFADQYMDLQMKHQQLAANPRKNSRFTDQEINQQINLQQPSPKRKHPHNRGNSLQKRRVPPIQNSQEPGMPVRIRRRR